MASDVTLSKGVRQNLLSLQSTAELLNRTQERLSTGKKVNSALDNPINFFTSSGLSSRANDLSRLLDSVGNAVQTLAAADKGISAITKLIETASATARQALTAAEGTTAYSVTQTGNVAIDDDIAATGTGATITADIAAVGTGSVNLAVDVASAANGAAFNAGDFDALALATLSIDTSDIANMVDGDTFSFDFDGTTYTFENDVGNDGVAGANIEFDGTHGDLVNVITGLFGPAGTAFTGTVQSTANSITITAATGSTDSFANLVNDADIALTDTAFQAASTFTIDDGVNPVATFTFVSAGASAAAGTFSTRDQLVAAINHANSGLNGSVTAAQIGADGLRISGVTNGSVFTVGGDGQAALGFNAGQYTVANAAYNADLAALNGQSFSVNVGGTNTVVNLTAASTRASVLATIGGVASFVGNNLVLTAANNDDVISVSGGAASAVGFGVGNNAFNPNAGLANLAGQSLTFSFGNTDIEVDFGTGAGQVDTRDELLAALGARGSLDANALVLTAANNTDNISVSGDAGALAALGFGVGNNAFGPTNAQVAGFTGQFTIQVGSGPAQTIEFGNGNAGEIRTRGALEARLASINSSLTGVTLSITGADVLNVSSTSSESITIGGAAAASFGVGAATYTPTETFTANATRTSLQQDYNNLLTQITQLAGDASFNGINLLDGDNLTVTFNEDGSSTLGIAGVTFSASGLGLTSVNGAGFQENANVNSAIAQLDAATATLRSQASKFGSNLSIVQTRQDFTKNMISVLQIGADNLVLADTNEEGANMLALNTRQQLSTTALSLAAQADQNVLRLF